MEQHSIIYCDESGNDGPNYLNDAEPFYVLAGWIVPNNTVVEATVEVEMMRQRHYPKSAELKFGNFRRKTWAINEFVLRSGQLGMIPVYVLAEKRFCVAGKIVETFLDPVTNPKLKAPFTGDATTKRQLANTLYERLSDRSLRRFAEAYRNPATDDLQKALTDITNECEGHVNVELAELLEGCRPNLSEIAKAEITAVETWGKAMGTLNLPCLVSFLMLIEQLGRQHNFRTLKIVHDEQGPYQEDYRSVFEDFRNPDDESYLFTGMRVSPKAIRTIDDFEVQRSVDQPLVQAADLLAGSIAHLSRKLVRDEVLHPQEIELGGFVLTPLLFKEFCVAWPVCSDKMFEKMSEAIRASFPDHTAEINDKRPHERQSMVWSSTLPKHGDLAVLPPRPEDAKSEGKPDARMKFTLPIFGLARTSDDQLAILLPPDDLSDETLTYDRCLPLWTHKNLAIEFLEAMEWSEPHCVVEFDVPELPELIRQLREQSEWVEIAVINLGDKNVGHVPILPVASDLDRIYQRFVRAATSGMIDVLFKHHEIRGHAVGTLLMSSGEYGAMRLSDELMATGSTRDQALKNLEIQMTDSSA